MPQPVDAESPNVNLGHWLTMQCFAPDPLKISASPKTPSLPSLPKPEGFSYQSLTAAFARPVPPRHRSQVLSPLITGADPALERLLVAHLEADLEGFRLRRQRGR